MALSVKEQMKEALMKKVKESYDRKDDSGQFKYILKSGLPIWKIQNGEHGIDILPYRAGVDDPCNKAGDWAYVLDIWVHYEVGINKDAYVCLARNYNKSCPICEEREKLRKSEEYDDELIKSLTPKRRTIYNVVVRDNEKEEAKGVQIWDVAHWFMEKYLTPLAKTKVTKGGHSIGGFIPFMDLEDGKTVCFERRGQGQKNTEYIGHKFVDREQKITKEESDGVFVLDQQIHIPSYDEIADAFYGRTTEVVKESEFSENIDKGFEPDNDKEDASPECLVENGIFGKDSERYSECETCKVNEVCAEETYKGIQARMTSRKKK